jgi:[acyl-carrier-protein] S-malonyltransferase
MGRPWVDHPSWELVADASEVARRDLAHLLLEADAAELTETRNAQLATFTLSLVMLDAVERLGIEPTAAAGHSLGEYTALVAAGALSFDDGVAIVTERGEAMQAAADDEPGTMTSILGLDDETVDVACRRADGDVWIANYNAPEDVVIAGSDSCVESAVRTARALGARNIVPVAVGGAFHTPFMAPARLRLRKALREATFRSPEVPVIANVDALPHDTAEEWQGLLSAQLCSPVRWRQTILALAGQGAQGTPDRETAEQLFVELGPGNSLTSLTTRILPEATALAVSTPDDLDELVATMAGRRASALSQGNHGEHLYVSERVVISPCAGLFQPPEEEPDVTIEVGSLLGRVADQEVRSPFQGLLMGMLALPGERVQAGQPVAWLRAAAS